MGDAAATSVLFATLAGVSLVVALLFAVTLLFRFFKGGPR